MAFWNFETSNFSQFWNFFFCTGMHTHTYTQTNTYHTFTYILTHACSKLLPLSDTSDEGPLRLVKQLQIVWGHISPGNVLIEIWNTLLGQGTYSTMSIIVGAFEIFRASHVIKIWSISVQIPNWLDLWSKTYYQSFMIFNIFRFSYCDDYIYWITWLARNISNAPTIVRIAVK